MTSNEKFELMTQLFYSGAISGGDYDAFLREFECSQRTMSCFDEIEELNKAIVCDLRNKKN